MYTLISCIRHDEISLEFQPSINGKQILMIDRERENDKNWKN